MMDPDRDKVIISEGINSEEKIRTLENAVREE